MDEVELTVVCSNESCPNYEQVVNKPVIPIEDYEAVADQWGHGSEDQYDYCPHCGELGELLDGYQLLEN